MKLRTSLMILPALLMGASFLGACGSDQSSDDAGGAGYATKVTKCKTDSTGFTFNTNIEITNKTDDTQSYIVHVDVSDESGEKITESHTTSGDLGAGETVNAEGLAQVPDGFKGEVSCKVTDVTVD